MEVFIIKKRWNNPSSLNRPLGEQLSHYKVHDYGRLPTPGDLKTFTYTRDYSLLISVFDYEKRLNMWQDFNF